MSDDGPSTAPRSARRLNAAGGLLIGAVAGAVLATVITVMVLVANRSDSSSRTDAVQAEIAALEVQKAALLEEHERLAREAEAQTRANSSAAPGAAIFDALDDLDQASTRRLRSQEIIDELVTIQERINELSGLSTAPAGPNR